MSGDVHVRICERLGVRFPRATRLVVLIDAHPRHDWLVQAVEKRIREEMAKLRVEINEEKSRIVDLAKGGSFSLQSYGRSSDKGSASR